MELSDLRPGTIRVDSANGADFLYRLVGKRQYIRKDGDVSTVLTWSGRCAVCHREFTSPSWLGADALPRTCVAHRGQWHSGSAKRRRATVGKA